MMSLQSTQTIPTDQLQPNPWNRTHFDPLAMKDLVRSIKTGGIREPLIVRRGDRPLTTGQGPVPISEVYQIVSGQRRWLAAKEAGLKKVPCIIQDLSDQDVQEMNLVANIHREDIQPLEQARMIKELMEASKLTQEGVAKRLGKSQPWVSELLGFLELPGEVLKNISALIIGYKALQAIKRLSTPDLQIQVSKELKEGVLKPEGVEKRVQELLGKSPGKAIKHPTDSQTEEQDPLQEVWVQLWTNPAIATQGTWKVRYKGGLDWSFDVHATSMNFQEYLAGWFGRMSRALGGDGAAVLPSLEETAQRIQKVKEETEREEALLPQPQESDLIENARFPRDQKEMAELEAAAKSGGPAAVYRWIYGPKSTLAEMMQGASWEDMGMGDPVSGCRRLLQMISETAKDVPAERPEPPKAAAPPTITTRKSSLEHLDPETRAWVEEAKKKGRLM